MKIALIPGSFDPITEGHMSLISRTAKIFDKVVVAVMTNDSEKYGAAKTAKQYMFTQDERTEMATASCRELKNVEVISAGGLLIDLFDRVGASVIVKGVRNEKDFTYERMHSDWNLAHNPNAETLYMPSPDGDYSDLSSTYVRMLIRENQTLSGVLTPEAIEIIEKIKGDRKL